MGHGPPPPPPPPSPSPLAAPPLAIPEVDLSAPDAATQFREACVTVGFFYLVNHGIPRALLDEVYAQSAAFFHQPLDLKREALANKHMRGYTPMSEETLDPAHQTQGDTKEGYYIGRPVADDEPAWPLHGPNVFPDPRRLPHFRPVMERYFALMTALGQRVARLFAAAAGAPTAFDQPGAFDRPMAALRLLHYGAVASDLAKGIVGAGAHTDYGLVTLLSTDANPGLQIQPSPDGPWLDVPPRHEAFIVNIGDMAERWTNGRFRSTRHRVVNVTGRERFSVPFFFEPNFDCRVECFASCTSPENPPRYAPTTSGEHLLERYRATHASFENEAETPAASS